MNPSVLRTLTLLGSLALSAFALQAQGAPGRGPGQGGPGFRHAGQHLALSEAQKEQFKAIHARHKAALEAHRTAVQEARKALHESVKANADAKALKAAHQKVADAQFQMLLERKALREEILPILTPEQKARFEARQAQDGPRGGRRGMGHGRGFGQGAAQDCPVQK